MLDGRELSEAIATTWTHISVLLGDDREVFERQVIPLLRRLDGTTGREQADLVDSILKLFQRYHAANQQLKEAIARLTGRTKGGIAPAGSVRMHRYTAVPVCYGTDRLLMSNPDDTKSYGCERGDFTTGFATVSIPDDHRMGEVEKPRLWKLEFRESPQKHVMVLQIEPLTQVSFVDRSQRALKQSSKNEVLLFVHGYNVGFADAICRTAQIAYDLHFEGLPALYSWPSEGSVPKYTVDETNVTWSRPRFAHFLRLLREDLGANAIHIIAHSMGNRLVAETIASMTPAVDSDGARIRQIVLAAPDIDAATFKDLAAAFPRKAERFTLYASSEDAAIRASKVIHKYPRAGDSGMGLIINKTIDTVDATAVDTSFIGHSYYGENRSVLSDIFELIRRGSPPEERFGLISKSRYGEKYWLFRS